MPPDQASSVRDRFGAAARAALTAAFAVLALAAVPAAAQPAIGDMTMGNPDAPVTVIEYASMTCPHCANFHRDNLPRLKAEFIDTGQVLLVFRDFPLDQLAVIGAVLARCAGPERYFPFVDALFRQQEAWARSDDPLQALSQIGQLGGVNRAAFDACLENEQLVDAVVNSRLQAEQQYGVGNTPTFIVNGVLVENQPWDDFAAILRAAAAGEAIADDDEELVAEGGNSGTYLAIAIVLGLLAVVAFFFLRRPARPGGA